MRSFYLVASWLARQQGEAIECLRAENRVLRSRLGKTMPWKTFLKAHWGAIAAADFFSVEVLTARDFVRYLVLFVIELKTRRVHVAGITNRADGEWMAQIARNLTDTIAGPLRGSRYLIVDRDPLYTAHFKSLLDSAGVKLLRLPKRSPNLNAFAERFVRSIKEECLRHVVPLGEGHLRRTVGAFVAHYHSERNHQGLGNVIPFPHSSARGREWSHPPPRTPWRTTQLLRTIRGVNCDRVLGQNGRKSRSTRPRPTTSNLDSADGRHTIGRHVTASSSVQCG